MPQSRALYFQHLPEEINLLTGIEQRIDAGELDARLVELVRLRVSQINGCSFCVAYHTARLRRREETNERIDQVAVWHESPCFSEQERAALHWAESVTQLPGSSGIREELYAPTVAAFGEAGTAQLTLVVAMINLWNRFGVAFQTDHQFVAPLLAQTSHGHS